MLSINKVVSITIGGGTPYAREYTVEINRDVPKGTIVVASAEETHLLLRAIEAEAAQAVQANKQVSEAPKVPEPIIVAAGQQTSAELIATLTAPIVPPREKGRGHRVARIGTLGCDREQLIDALGKRGNRLNGLQNAALMDAVAGVTTPETAQRLGVSEYAINTARREGASRLGFQPLHYPKVAVAMKDAAAKRLGHGAVNNSNGGAQ